MSKGKIIFKEFMHSNHQLLQIAGKHAAQLRRGIWAAGLSSAGFLPAVD